MRCWPSATLLTLLLLLLIGSWSRFNISDPHFLLEPQKPLAPVHVQAALPLSGTILVTGAAGFIGFHFTNLLLRDPGVSVVGVDNLNDYYSVRLKEQRIKVLQQNKRFSFIRLDIADSKETKSLFTRFKFSRVVHLAAQAGVRHSFKQPLSYVSSNLVGFVNIIEGMRLQPNGTHLIYASSSSIYGANTKIPFSEEDRVDSPMNLYAATKKADEALAYSYASLYGIPCTGLRFFTVYGPWGRPDMAVWQFTDTILNGGTIKVYLDGQMQRDFTFVDDVVWAMRLLMHLPPTHMQPPHRVLNIGNSEPTILWKMIFVLEAAIGKRAKIVKQKSAPGEVMITSADVSLLYQLTGYTPRVDFCVGAQQHVDWYARWLASNETLVETYVPLIDGSDKPLPALSSVRACKA